MPELKNPKAQIVEFQCPKCKTETELVWHWDTTMKEDEVWLFCRRCGTLGGELMFVKSIQEIDDDRAVEIAVALTERMFSTEH